jgi:putative pyruvate formate lyase activating enzyme
MPLETVVQTIRKILTQTENIVGFVSPSHFIPHVKAIIEALRAEGFKPIFVYNTNGYDKADTLKNLEGYIDVYLSDFKYLQPELALAFSQARNYPEVAGLALKEMFRQKGPSLHINDRGLAESGIIVRHLVLPNAVENSLAVLKFISEEISSKLYISLMAQYYPTSAVKNIPQLNRTITEEEYDQVVEAFHHYGFYRGWVQELDSQQHLRPSFENDNPFEI